MNIMDDIQFKLSNSMTDFSYGGGTVSYLEVEDEAVNNVFNDTTVGYLLWEGSRFRKIFIHNTNNTETLVSAAAFIFMDSQADDSLSVRSGTITDTIEDADDYSGWHKTGTILDPIVGSLNKLEGPKTREFRVSVLEDDSSGFYVGNRIYVFDGRRYSILVVEDLTWLSSTVANLKTTYDSEISFSSGAKVSSIVELGNIEPNNYSALWIKQFIPSDSNTYNETKPIIGLLGV